MIRGLTSFFLHNRVGETIKGAKKKNLPIGSRTSEGGWALEKTNLLGNEIKKEKTLAGRKNRKKGGFFFVVWCRFGLLKGATKKRRSPHP